MYLTGASNPAVLSVAHEDGIGRMLQPGNGYRAQLGQWPYFGADNGCFSQGERFSLPAFLGWLDTLPRDGCLFAVAPDVYGDHAATLARSLPVLPQIRALGFPAAFVAQDGATTDGVPWGDFDVLFLGGAGLWKLSPPAWALCGEAAHRGVPVHMGRCNSERRLRAAQVMGCRSADGTYLKFGPDTNLPRLRGWLRTCRAQPSLWEAAAG